VPTYYGAIAQVKLYDRKGAGESGEIPSVSLGAPGRFPFVTGVSVQLAQGGIPSVSVNLNAPYSAGREMLDHGTLFSLGNVISTRIGYPDSGEFTDWYSCILNQGGMGLILSPDGLSGSITGAASALSGFGTVTPDTTDMDGLAAITRAAAGLGMELDASEHAIAVLTTLSPSEFQHAAGSISNFSELKVLLDQFGLFGFGASQDRRQIFRVRTIEELTSQAPSVTLAMRQGFDAQTRTYPLLNFTPEAGIHAFAHGPSSSAARGISSWRIDDDMVMRRVDTAPEEMPVQGGQEVIDEPSPTDATIQTDGGPVVVDIAPDHEVEGLGSQQVSEPIPDLLQERQQLSEMYLGDGTTGLRVSWACAVGIHDLLPGDLFRAQTGAGMYDGSYWIEGLTHDWSPQGFRTSGTAISRTSSSLEAIPLDSGLPVA
tara:strand:- start:2257 stop:3543 length:1287 start_codon:yes stop_codon:yes gene_type:complete